ncbi:5-formyltetrahydrofolate cyclo-ligase [Sphingomonas abietis]|uniref:5-formyltetrahydrofolate cyclo-ligase n=1 Tax=Sphingomonas abietis TaxID=3012344 RepID=A0ABY7NQ13_9SPHN|nr:5-formyltetrahydrofolate cyclo-ligase [Sphingomonas abietis]WBO23622.1 5-formyltetrahydrofolate cyclo-ligase [Sphingomonas abietis]
MAVPPPIPDPGFDALDKAEQRRALRARRRAFVGDAAAIERRLAPLLSREGPIAGYVAHRGEPDILPFLSRAFHLGHEVALPVPGDDAMHFVRWHPDITMQPGLAGIPQPADGRPIAPAIILAPLLGFDRAGHRLGQGGGYYDRWFAAHPQAWRIGVAWSIQEVERLHPEPWDMPLHAIVTEKEWIEP